MATRAREERVAHTRESRPSDQPGDDDDLEFSNTCLGISGVVVAVFIGLIVWALSGPVDPLDSKVEQFRNDEALRVVLWPGQTGGGSTRGSNSRETDWAVFFYKCAPHAPNKDVSAKRSTHSVSSRVRALSQAVLRRVQARVARLPRPRRDHQHERPAALRRGRLHARPRRVLDDEG